MLSLVSRRTAKSTRLQDILASRHGPRIARGNSATSVFTAQTPNFDTQRPSQGTRSAPTQLPRLSAHPPVQKDANAHGPVAISNVRHESGRTVESDFTFTDMHAYEKQGKPPASAQTQTTRTTGGEDRADLLLPNVERQRSKEGNWV